MGLPTYLNKPRKEGRPKVDKIKRALRSSMCRVVREKDLLQIYHSLSTVVIRLARRVQSSEGAVSVRS